jgi:copper chaperone CopZ
MILRFFSIILIALFTLISCQSNINRIELKIETGDSATILDTLKYSLIGLAGITYVAISPDTDHISIKYDRYQTHSDRILEAIQARGYYPVLIEKKRVNKKEPY